LERVKKLWSSSSLRIEENDLSMRSALREHLFSLLRSGILELPIIHGLWAGIPISPREADELRSQAEALILEAGGLTIPEIIARHRIRVTHSSTLPDFAEHIFRADIDCGQGVITIYDPIQRELQEAIASFGIALPAHAGLDDMVTAHEICHFLEFRGRFRRGERSIKGEMRAHLFTGAILRLPFYPWVLDLAHLAYRAPERVIRKIEEIIQYR
jgi:hypothetical protein